MANENKTGSIILGLAATLVVGGVASQTAVKWDEANQSPTTTTQTTKGLYASATVMYAVSALVLLVGTIITLGRKV